MVALAIERWCTASSLPSVRAAAGIPVAESQSITSGQPQASPYWDEGSLPKRYWAQRVAAAASLAETLPDEWTSRCQVMAFGATERGPESPTHHAARPLSDRASLPIWDLFEEILKDVPENELRKLPRDGAEQHDHYIYGTPKRP